MTKGWNRALKAFVQYKGSDVLDASALLPATGLISPADEKGTFSLCTGWYVDALTRSGRLDEAQLVFEKMLTYADHVGLFSEEIGLTGEQLGTFTHLSLIKAAVNLDRHLDGGMMPELTAA
jgi:GH15 family glucan-1,4-alpha-glucosidase